MFKGVNCRRKSHYSDENDDILDEEYRLSFGLRCHCLEYSQFLASHVCIHNRNYNSREFTGATILCQELAKEGIFFYSLSFSFRGFVFDVLFLPFDHSTDSYKKSGLQSFATLVARGSLLTVNLVYVHRWTLDFDITVNISITKV